MAARRERDKEREDGTERERAVKLFSLFASCHCRTSLLKWLYLKSALKKRHHEALCAQACLSDPGRVDFTDELSLLTYATTHQTLIKDSSRFPIILKKKKKPGPVQSCVERQRAGESGGTKSR